MSKELQGQVAIVTGGSTGLGKAMALKLGQAGCKVVIASRKLENLNPAKDEIAKSGASVIACQTDVREPEQVQAMVDQTIETFGRVDILINNAAGNFAVPSEKLTVNGWKAVVEIVLNGTWFCSSSCGKEMIKQGSGVILNIIANYAWTGAPGAVHSASAKGGVLAMTRTLAVEWGRYGIRVNAFAPGPMVTEAASKNLLFASEEAQDKLRKKNPLGRLTDVDEMSEVALFLCGPKSAYINGDVMTADGGSWLGRGFMDMMPN